LIALFPKTRCKSPISSGFKFHSLLLSGCPFDNLLPDGSPLMTILLEGGIPSVPSMVIGRLTSWPTTTSTKEGADRTGVTTESTIELLFADNVASVAVIGLCCAGIVAAAGLSRKRSHKRGTRVRFGSSATKIKTLRSTQIFLGSTSKSWLGCSPTGGRFFCAMIVCW